MKIIVLFGYKNTLQLERIWQKWFSTSEKKIQKMLIPRLLPFYVVKITQKSKQNEPGQNAQDSLVFSKLRYCEMFFNKFKSNIEKFEPNGREIFNIT